MKTAKPLWTACKWPFNNAEPYASWQCWQRKHGRGRIILMPSQLAGQLWSYCASFGANSDLSHSGGFPDGFTLEQAQAKIEQLISLGKFYHHST